MASATTSTQELHVAQPQRFPSGTLHLASDYGLHVTNAQDEETKASSAASSTPRTWDIQPAEFDRTVNDHPWDTSAPQRADWTDGWREIPPIRPPNRELDLTLRAQSFPYNVGARVMLTGCWAQSLVAKLWLNTVQRIVPYYGDTPIGGKF
ncbi:uncharacterized protein FTJAE_12950 [Fusarium tjaetaba]|uniref:Uncharacterized protein n=1 Tax=Fusarium tjaetaba TaxID=1567544 RepID=A0A8H5VC03_9HYPO|nr:uncharacterized protein FTJAE_12950 [Fusarium tjaetaba]KAF5616475.1 hypothetical protein FTJAE_12950 [Fusarium tjaetaba]